jgi:tetratricopeptide (TPR) repeat protein
MKPPAASIIVVVALGLRLEPVYGEYVTVETRLVPVARLVQNLERELERDQRSIPTLINLARLHGMAYALKTDEATVARNKSDQPWYGYEPNYIPYEVKVAVSPGQTRAAAAHLERALDYYKRALALEPSNLLGGIGYGWALEQSGATSAAIAQYRRVIDQAWQKEQSVTTGDLGQRFYTEEAAGYLIKLLDPKTDAAEIAELDARRKTLSAVPRPITPIVIPLRSQIAADAILDTTARVDFDADGSGLRRPWSWVTPDVGWLVYDPQHHGRITSALQWFGNVTFWLVWHNGYEALASLDDNEDGELSGGELRHLAIWRDENGNGRSDADEVRPLHAHGVVALSCRYLTGDRRRFAAISPTGARFESGESRPTYDVILRPAVLTVTR